MVDAEFNEAFMEEFENLTTDFQIALNGLRDGSKNKKDTYEEFFKVLHTIKGNTRLFPEEVSTFHDYIMAECEHYRDLDETKLMNPNLLSRAEKIYARLSNITLKLAEKRSLDAFQQD